MEEVLAKMQRWASMVRPRYWLASVLFFRTRRRGRKTHPSILSSFIFGAEWPPFSDDTTVVDAGSDPGSSFPCPCPCSCSSLTSATGTASPFSAFARFVELESDDRSGEEPLSRLTEVALVAVTGGEESVSAIIVFIVLQWM